MGHLARMQTNVWFNALLKRTGLGSSAVSTLIHSNWFPMMSLSHDALGQPPIVRLHHDRLGPQDPVSIDFEAVAMEIDLRSSSMLVSNMVALL